MSEKRFFTYKGYPLVRLGDQLYYGNMYDNYVVWMQILSKEKKGDLEVASKVKMYKMATDPSLPPMKAIVKQSERPTLYSALDMAYAWLGKQNA
ncbi:MAG: hypothetical protein IKR73_08180 [Oscillospiraceae bacterium]|nr:hypothetical protein [Oscillospiraceae bacterium]